MAPRTGTGRRAAVSDENTTIGLSVKDSVETASVQERKVLAERNSQLEAQLEELTKKLGDVELGKQQAEQKSAKMEQQMKDLKKAKGFVPSFCNVDAKLSQEEPALKNGKSKDNKPKQPQSAYLYFCSAMREQVKNEYPDADFTETTKIIAEKWKIADDGAKAPFEHKAAEDTIRYQTEMNKYNKDQAAKKEEATAMEMLQTKQEQELAQELFKQYQEWLKEEEEPPAKSSKDNDPNKPKKGLNAFMFFSTERRRALLQTGQHNVVEISKALGEEWKKMNKSKKTKYNRLAEKDAARYKSEMQVYTAKKEDEAAVKQAENAVKLAEQKAAAAKLLKEKKMEEAGAQLLKGQKKAEQEMRKEIRDEKKARKAKREGQPKRAPSAYLLYCNEEREVTKEKHPGAPMVDIQKFLAESWKNVDTSTKVRLQAQSDALSAEYRSQMEAWRATHGPEDTETSSQQDDGEEVSSA